MLLDNTQWVGGNGLNLKGYNPSRYLAAAGDGYGIDWENPENVGMAVNSELLYLTNLWRQARGLPPVNPSTAAPTVNVGLSPEVKNALIMGGLAIGALILLSRRKA